MAEDPVVIVVVPSPDEPPIATPGMQSVLHAFSSSLRDAGMKTSPRMLFMDDAVTPVSWIGEFTGLLQAMSPLVAGALVAWIGGRAGRKVRLKIGDVEAEANSIEDVERLLELARNTASRNSPASSPDATDSPSGE